MMCIFFCADYLLTQGKLVSLVLSLKSFMSSSSFPTVGGVFGNSLQLTSWCSAGPFCLYVYKHGMCVCIHALKYVYKHMNACIYTFKSVCTD